MRLLAEIQSQRTLSRHTPRVCRVPTQSGLGHVRLNPYLGAAEGARCGVWAVGCGLWGVGCGYRVQGFDQSPPRSKNPFECVELELMT